MGKYGVACSSVKIAKIGKYKVVYSSVSVGKEGAVIRLNMTLSLVAASMLWVVLSPHEVSSKNKKDHHHMTA